MEEKREDHKRIQVLEMIATDMENKAKKFWERGRFGMGSIDVEIA